MKGILNRTLVAQRTKSTGTMGLMTLKSFYTVKETLIEWRGSLQNRSLVASYTSRRMHKELKIRNPEQQEGKQPN